MSAAAGKRTRRADRSAPPRADREAGHSAVQSRVLNVPRRHCVVIPRADKEEGNALLVRAFIFRFNFPNSPVHTITFNWACVIAPAVWSAWGAPSFPLSLTSVRGAERRKAHHSQVCTLRCRAPCDRHARLPALHLWRFSPSGPCFLAWTGGIYRSRYPGGICAAVHPDPSSH